MKLAEVKELADGKVYLSNGYFLDYDFKFSKPDHEIWAVKQLLDEDGEVGEATIRQLLRSPGDSLFKLTLDDSSDVKSLQYRPVSEKQKKEAFFDWVEKNLPK